MNYYLHPLTGPPEAAGGPFAGRQKFFSFFHLFLSTISPPVIHTVPSGRRLAPLSPEYLSYCSTTSISTKSRLHALVGKTFIETVFRQLTKSNMDFPSPNNIFGNCCLEFLLEEGNLGQKKELEKETRSRLSTVQSTCVPHENKKGILSPICGVCFRVQT